MVLDFVEFLDAVDCGFDFFLLWGGLRVGHIILDLVNMLELQGLIV